MSYRFKALPELYWSIITAASIVLLTGLVTLDPEKIVDWRAWAVAIGGGIVRAAAGAALDWLRRHMTEDTPATLADQIAELSPDEKRELLDLLDPMPPAASGGRV